MSTMARETQPLMYEPAVPVGLFRRALRSVAGFLIPQACVHCRREGELLCYECFSGLERVAGARCVSCGEVVGASYSICSGCVLAPPPLDRLAPVYRYQDAARSAVLALKFRSLKSIAPIMARPMSLQPLVTRGGIDCLVPVPSHGKRLRERGYNQAALLAKEIASISCTMLVERGLRKVKHTPSQVDLNREERSNSVRGAFEAEFDFTGAHVVLVDDVATTGSTLMACASALKRANASRVSALTFAKETAAVDNETG